LLDDAQAGSAVGIEDAIDQHQVERSSPELSQRINQIVGGHYGCIKMLPKRA
jgi:hypothetical protein